MPTTQYMPEIVPIRIPVEDAFTHTREIPFCTDPTCPCHEDEESTQAVAAMVGDGTLTPAEATRFVQGHQL